MVKEGAVIIDVGVNRVDGKLVGAIHHDKESFDRNGISLSPVSDVTSYQ